MEDISDAERQRLATLRRYRILDTPADEGFDRLTRVARALMDAPMAMVSLTDHDRQWFKSRTGLRQHQSPRSEAFCPYAVVARDVVHVPDATADERFADLPIVRGDPGVRFYCGAPLFAADGTVPGTLCVLDTRPRHDITDAQIDRLRDLAAAVSDYMEYRHGLERARREEAQLASLRRLLDAVYDALGVGVVVTDRQQHVLHANQGFAVMAGTDAAALPGGSFDDWIGRGDERSALRTGSGDIVPVEHAVEPVELSGRAGLELHTIADRRDPESEIARHRGRARIFERITQQLDPGGTLRAIVEYAADVGTPGAAFLYLYREPNQRPMVVAPELEALGSPGYLEGLLGELNAAVGDDDAVRICPLGEVASDAAVPLRRALRCEGVALQTVSLEDGTRAGTLGVFLGRAEDSDELRCQLAEMARISCLTLSHSDMLARLQWGAYHDVLTGLPNQRLLPRRFAEARDRARQAGESIAVLAIDLQGLDAISEHHGRAAADELLRRASAVLTGSLRSGDVVARISGDELAVVARVAQPEHVRVLAAKVVDLVAAAPVPGDASISAAVGVTLDSEGADFDGLVAEAESAMSAAAAAGGHQWRPARSELA